VLVRADQQMRRKRQVQVLLPPQTSAWFRLQFRGHMLHAAVRHTVPTPAEDSLSGTLRRRSLPVDAPTWPSQRFPESIPPCIQLVSSPDPRQLQLCAGSAVAGRSLNSACRVRCWRVWSKKVGGRGVYDSCQRVGFFPTGLGPRHATRLTVPSALLTAAIYNLTMDQYSDEIE
jgi:hypothetical protein